MIYTGLQRFYTIGIQALFYSVPFLPLYISNSMLFPYITGRNFIFRILVEAALVLWLGLLFLNKDYRPTLSRVMQAVLVFVAIVFVADLFGASFYRSFWSNYERMEGFLTIAHMALFFIITATVFRFREWRIFAHLVLIGSFGVGCWALLQRLGILQSLQGGNRVEGSIGNPSYLAAYLLLASFIAAILFLNTDRRWLRYLYGAGILFELLIIYFSATRGTVLALIVGLVLFAVLYFLFARRDGDVRRYRMAVVGILGAAILVPFFFWSIRDTEFVKSSPPLQRLASTSFSSQTIQSRMLIWSLAWKGIKEHPVLGWGQENFNLIFNKHFHPKLWQQEPWFDRAHSIVLDWLSSAGILGLLAYLSLFAAAFYALYSLYISKVIHTITFATAITAFATHFGQNLFVFDNFNTYFIFFGALAFLHSTAFQWKTAPEAQKNADAVHPAIGVSITVFAIALIGGAFAVYYFNLKPMQQSKELIHTLQLIRGDAPSSVVMPAFTKTFSYNALGNREVTEQLAQYGTRVSDTTSIPNDEKRAVLAEVIQRLEREAALVPDDIRYGLFLASMGYLRAAFFDAQFVPKAEQEFKRIIELSPTKQQLYIGLAQLYLGLNDYEKAFEVSKAMYEIDPEYPDGGLFYVVTAIYSQRLDIAEKFLVERPEFKAPPRGVFIANAYAAIKQFPPMIPLYLYIIKGEPNNPQYHANLAAVYAQLGERDLARKEAEEAIRLDPGFKEQGGAFLKSLGF